MSPATAPHPVPRNSAELEIDKAVHRVYEKYGADLGAFFRDVNPRPESSSTTSAPLKSASAARRRTKSA